MRMQRQTPNRGAGRVAYGIRDCRRGRHGRRLADADHASLGHVVQHDVDLRHVGHPGQQVELHVRIHHLTGHAVEEAVLVQRKVDGRDDAAVHLALRGQPIDDEAAVLHREDALDADDARLDIDGHVGELHAARAGAGEAVLPLPVDRNRLGAEQLAGVLPRQALRSVGRAANAAAFCDEIVSLNADGRRDLREQLIERVGAGHADRRRHRRRGRAAAGSAAERILRIADLGRDGVHRHTERFGGDDRDDRARAGAEVLRAAFDHDAAVGVDVDVRRRSASGAAPQMRRYAHAGLDRTRRRIAGRMTLLPPEAPRAFLKVFDPLRVWRDGRRVPDAELDRVDLHAIGELVHQDLGEEASLWMSRRAHRALLARVDVHVGVDALPIRKLIEVRQREIRSGARAAGAPAPSVERRQLPFGRHAGADVRERGRTVTGVEMLLLAIEHQLHRRVGELRELRADDPLRVGRELAAEAATHVLRDHAHVRLRDAERLGVTLRALVHALSRDPRRELVAVPLAHRAVRFEAHVRDDVRRIRLLDDVRRVVESRFEVARLLADARTRVLLRRAPLRRRRVHGLRFDRHVRQRFPSYAHEPRGVARALFRVGRNRRDRIALVMNFVAGISVRHDRFHAGRLLRRGEIDRRDARVRIWRAHDPAVDHPGPVDVVGVPRAARDFIGAVEAHDSRRKECRFFGPRVLSHAPPPCHPNAPGALGAPPRSLLSSRLP